MKHLILIAALLVAACSSQDDNPPPKQQQQEGRAETRAIRNTQAVGINGKAIADNVDKAMKANEDAVKKTEKETNDGPETPPAQDPQPQQ
jgi:hypothetical protein